MPTIVLVCENNVRNLVQAALLAGLQMKVTLISVPRCSEAAQAAINAKARYILVDRDNTEQLKDLLARRPQNTVRIFHDEPHAAEIITKLLLQK